MKFTKFLIERAANSRHTLTYQKLLMALDKAHISRENNYYEFNLGSVVKDSSLSGLFVRISESNQPDTKLGQHKDGRFFIVVTTPKLPDRMQIDSLLSENKDIMYKFIDCIQEYYNQYRENTEVEPNKKEKQEALYDKENIEQNYDELIKAIDLKFQEYKAAIDELEDQKNKTVNAAKKVAAEEAQKRLKNEYFGSNENEFVKKVRKYEEAEFISLLDKKYQKTIEKRLENYYDQKID